MKKTIFVLFFIFAAINLYSSGLRDRVNNTPNIPADSSAESIDIIENENSLNETRENIIKITGRVQVYGNEPHTFVGIIDENGAEYAVYPREQEIVLRSLQGRLIEFTVILFNEPMNYGSQFLKGGTVEPIEWTIIR